MCSGYFASSPAFGIVVCIFHLNHSIRCVVVFPYVLQVLIVKLRRSIMKDTSDDWRCVRHQKNGFCCFVTLERWLFAMFSYRHCPTGLSLIINYYYAIAKHTRLLWAWNLRFLAKLGSCYHEIYNGVVRSCLLPFFHPGCQGTAYQGNISAVHLQNWKEANGFLQPSKPASHRKLALATVRRE